MKKIVLIFLSVIFLITLSSCESSREIDFDEILDERPVVIDETEEPIYTISFQTNGGTKVEPISRKTNTLSYAPTTIKEGYNFIGWYLDSALTQEASFPITIKEDMVLYAKWETKKYTVTFQSNGGTKVNTITTDTLHTAPNVEKDGYAFQGWYTDAALTQKAIFPMYLTKNITLYAKWLQKTVTVTANSVKIKDAGSYSSSKTIDITPKNLDLEELASQGYYITITVSYDVKYVKDYDFLLDIGYFGAPKYEIYLYRNNGIVRQEEDVKAPSSSTHRTMTYTEKVIDMKNAKFYFEVSTNNIQNIVYFENITVTYECTK